MSKWLNSPLGAAIKYRKQFIQIDDLSEYKRCRVQLHAQGIVLRDTIYGAQIKTKKQQVCKAGDFLVAEIDAKVGGFGIVPEELDKAIVSSHYYLFEINQTKLECRFLNYFIRTSSFREQVAAQGSTNYAAIRPDDVLDYKVPLPPLSEQRRIVARIEVLASKITEARRLQDEISTQCDDLCRSLIFDKSAQKSEPISMRELMTLRDPDVAVHADRNYQFAGIYCFGRGVFKGQTKSGMEFSYRCLTRLKSGNFAYPKLMAWEGALGVVPPDCDGLVVSTEFPVFEVDQTRVLPEVLDIYFRTPSVWPALARASTGTNVRRRRLSPKAFLEHRMPLPAMGIQETLRQVNATMGEIKDIQSETVSKLGALLPSILDRAFSGRLV